MTSLRRDLLLEQLTERLRQAGLRYPDAAAVALAARGDARLDRDAFARLLGVDRAEIDRAESGRVRLEELPSPLREAADRPE
jgi:DNA-binding transcriptional regulator YiaG